MSVYKINHLATNTIYVFCGNVPIETTDPTSFFSKDENNTIKEEKTSVKLINHLIHIDDTIGSIKTKLIMYLDLNLALEELYLFYRKHETLNSVSIYKTLIQSQKKSVRMVIVNKDKDKKTKSGKRLFELTKPLLDQILLNIYSDSKGTMFPGLPEKPVYTMDDILQLKLDNHTFVVDNVLGQKKSLNEGNIPFIYNPNNMVASGTKQIDVGTTFNNKLLMDSGDIINNTIYLCTTTDILGKTIPDPLLIQLYFPSLKNITSLEELTGKRDELIRQNKKIINDNTSSLFNSVDLFYNIHSSKTSDLDYKKKGIKYIKAVLKPDFNIKMPLEIIYKLLHATQSYPFIKYNPSSRQENSYRLFADRTATDGRKIPYLKKSEIFSLMKTMGRGKSVSVFVSNKDSSLVCEFDEFGSVVISSEFKTIVTLEQIDDLFRVSVNPILDEIKAVLEQSGYNIKLFNNLLDDSVDIQQLTYACDVAIQKAVNLDEIKGCVSSIFNNESTDFKTGIHLRFKRVSNFNKITSQEAFIIEMLKQSYSGDEIVKALMDNYKDDLTKEQAGDLVNKVANENNAERGKKKIRFDENPGFRTTLELDKRTGILSIEVDNINNIRHLTTLPIYIDSMLRLTQDITSSGIDVEQIQKLCSSMAEHVDVPLYKESEVELNTDKPLTDGLVDGDVNDDMNEINPDDLSAEAPKTNFNFLFDDDEEEEDEGDDNSAKEGGAVLPSIIDIDGTKIKKPNYFQKRIEDRDGVLIMKKDSVKYNSYSRTCSSDFRRQPVILNDAELERINKQHDGFLQKEDVIKYGSDKDKQFNYVCPRYWCLKTNTIILPSELEEKTDSSGNKYLEHPTCGKILPPDATKIIPGHYIYEFYKPKKGDPKFKRYPGLQVDKHPDGYCLPCCFDLYTELGETFIQDKCQKRSDSDKPDADKSEADSELKMSKNSTAVDSSTRKPNQKKDDEPDDYIKGPDKFPITQGRWGYMPVDVQKLLNEVNIDCQVNRASDNPCMLRHGVENNENQSFIACVSDFMFWGRKKIVGDKSELIKVPPSIRDMKQNILKSLTIDNFVKYQNGNLVSSFDVKSIEGLNMSDYKNVKAFESLDINKPEELVYFTRVVSSFENFKKYLEDDKVVIDHTYLWDILTTPNKLLFPRGINLVILNLPRDDITHNVQIICPSNQYSSIPYDLNKPTMILIKIDNYYEPVYSYGSTIIKEFKSDNEKLSENIRGVLQTTIKNVFDVNCKPLDSMPNRKNARVFPAYNATPLSTIVTSLERIKCSIVKQVINYNNKVIGIVADCSKIDAGIGFIPCYPSAPIDHYKAVFMFDTGIWNTYENTHNFLSKLNKNTGIRCRPVFKVIEDEVIVGILTETNQFVQLSQPVVSVEKDIDLHSIYNDSYIVDTKQKNMIQTDAQITTATGVDTDRVDYTNKIKMESNFYNVFRNTIRILLNDYDNVKIREQIEKLISNMYIIYSDKIKSTIKLLNSLVDDNIHFSGDENYYKIVNEVSTCIRNKKCGSSKVCAVTDDGKCSLILPEKNLITGKQNSEFYYEKIADELIRYSRIKSFMFQPQTYLAFGNIGYNLRENEIILIQSLLTQEYFERLIPIVANKYVSKNSIDSAKPNITQNYDNKVKNSDVSSPNRLDKSLVESDGLYKDINAEVNDSPVKQRQEPERETKNVEENLVDGDKVDNIEEKEKEKEKENVEDDEVNDDNGNCELKYSKITSSFWRKQFPVKFAEMSYGICGYKLMIDLIKSKTKEDKTINQLKNELFAEYNKYYENHRDKILDVLTFEGKKIMCDLVKKGKLAFTDFIQNDAYNMTTFDFLLFADKYKIPVVFVSQKNILQTNYSKQMFIGHGTKSDLFAFIYVPVLKSKQDPVYKLIVTDKKDLFMPLDVMVDKQILDQSFTNPLVIEEYLSAFSKSLISKKSNL